MSLRSLSIGTRSAAVFSLIAALIVIMGLTALYQAQKMNAVTNQIRVNWLPGLVSLGDIGLAIGRSRALTYRSLLSETKEDEIKTVVTIRNINSDIRSQIFEYQKSILSKEERKLYDDFEASLEKYFSGQEQILSSIEANSKSEAVKLIGGPVVQHADALMEAFISLNNFTVDGARNNAGVSSSTFDEAVNVIVVSLAIILLVMITIAILLTRSIVSPLADAIAVAEQVVGGDLTRTIQVKGIDEPAQLLRALKRLQNNLQQTIQKSSNSSNQLAFASEKLYAVTADSNQGLRQQSRGIDQTATAVNEMTAAFEDKTNNAVYTAEDSHAAGKSTKEGRVKASGALDSINALGKNVGTTSEEVKRLAESFYAISQMLVMIRSIADPVNLLALNAAIEAARTGEAGRGFALVSDEVRALAHRTQQSMAEIASMIDTIYSGADRAVEAMSESQTRVRRTLAVADAANDSLEIISDAITSLKEKNAVISNASEEQAKDAREVELNLVNSCDSSMPSSTDANQTTAAIQKLSRLAISLNEMISKFKL